ENLGFLCDDDIGYFLCLITRRFRPVSPSERIVEPHDLLQSAAAPTTKNGCAFFADQSGSTDDSSSCWPCGLCVMTLSLCNVRSVRHRSGGHYPSVPHALLLVLRCHWI
ncbi:uncharacterized protein PV09_07949, partial [Verruconis gallopava]